MTQTKTTKSFCCKNFLWEELIWEELSNSCSDIKVLSSERQELDLWLEALALMKRFNIIRVVLITGWQDCKRSVNLFGVKPLSDRLGVISVAGNAFHVWAFGDLAIRQPP